MDRKTILIPADCDLKRLPLGALEVFVLSHFDGRSTLEEIAEIAGLDFAAAAALAKRLVELGAASASDAPPPKGPRKSKAPPRARTEAPPASARAARSVRPARHDPRAELESMRPERHDPRVDKHSLRPARSAPPAEKRSLRPARQDDRAEKHSLRPKPRLEKDAARSEPAPVSGRSRPEARTSTTDGRRASRKSLRMTSVGGARAAASAADEVCELDEATYASIVAFEAKLKTHDHYALLQLDRSAEKKAVKSAYFGLAARFHPDRFFGKKLGRARAPLERVFHRVTEAHDVLTDGERRAAYDATLPPPPATPVARTSKAPPSRTPTPTPRKPSKKLSAVVAPTPAPKKPSLPPKRDTTARPPPAPRAIVPPPLREPQVAATTRGLSATMVEGSLRGLYSAAKQVEARRRVEVFVRAAEEALKADDVIGAANNFRLALQNGEDPHLRARLEDVDELAKKRRFELSVGRARAAERDRKWAEAAFEFSRAHEARPAAEAAERAAYALRMSEGDLQRATALAEYAVAKEPKNAGYRVTLGEVHLAANALERAAAAADVALGLAPNDPRAKQLAAAVKKRRR